MSSVKKKYESFFIVRTDIDEEALRATIEKFTSLVKENGTLESVDEWGKRRLAYPINDFPEGYYVLMNFECETSFIAELERIYRISEQIIRSLVIAK